MLNFLCDPDDTVFKPIIRKIQEDIRAKQIYTCFNRGNENTEPGSENTVMTVFKLTTAIITKT